MPRKVDLKSGVRVGLFAGLLFAISAHATPFNITITNTGTNTQYPWSVGLLTLSPTIAIGLSPQPGSATYPTYVYANSNCNVSDSYCTAGSCLDNGNAVVLAQRLGLTIGVNAWLVPALPAGTNASATVAIDAPAGSRLSFIAWINDTSVFDDFVSMHPLNTPTTLSVPLFDAAGAPLANPAFSISGYDTNSTSPTDGSGATCGAECPAATTGCYVAPGNASVGFPGTYPAQPVVAVPAMTLTASGLASTTTAANTYTLTYRNQSASAANAAVITYTLPAGVTFVSASNGATVSGSVVTWNLGNLAAGASGTRTVTVNLGTLGSTTAHSGQVTWTTGSGSNRRSFTLVSNVVTTVYTVMMTPAWTFTDPQRRTTDGLAVGDLVSGGNSELLVLAPTRATSGPGRAIVLRPDTGAELSSFSPGTGRNVMGIPLIDQLSTIPANPGFEYVFGEPLALAQDAGVYARIGSSGGLWTSLPYGYGAYWNMGPSSANVSAVAGTEVVLSDWDGNVRVLTGSTGAVQASYNTWTSDADHAFGHVALADVDGDGTLEAVIAGNILGSVMVLNADTLTLQWKSAPLKTLYGDFPYGSGAAVANIDADARAEIVVATRGTTGDIYAFDVSLATGSTCEHRFHPGGMVSASSPVIGDVDGSGQKSIVVVSSTAVLSVMKAGTKGCATAGGTIVWQHAIKAGDRSSFTPMLYDVNGDGVLDVIAASNTRIEIIDVRNRNVLLTFDDPTAAFSPSGAVANADSSSAVRELYVSGWRNSTVYRFNLPATATSTNDWTTFMGNNTRTGAR